MRLLIVGNLGVSTLLLISILGSCGRREADGNQAKKPAELRRPGGLAGELAEAKDLKSAVQATHTALAKGGISVMDGDQTVVGSSGPAASVFFSPGEAYALALEARHRASASRMTLAELGDMLHDLGWPFEGGPLPGEQLAQFLKVWITEARKNPTDPHSFTPLFLADLALYQVPAIDLAAAEYRPEQLRLTLLELHLLAAAFDRALPGKLARARLPDWLLPSVVHAQGDPCSRWKKAISKSYGDLTKGGTEIGSVALKEGVKALIKAGGEYGKKVADALSALSVAAKLWKLANLYAYNEFTVVVASNNPLHKPLKGQDNKEAVFTARAGVNDEEWEEFQRTLHADDLVRAQRDCLAELGIPVLPDQGDVGKDAEKWRVEWRLLPEWLEKQGHAYISRDKNREFDEKKVGAAPGQLQMNLSKSQDNDHSATATLAVDILPEKHEHKGIEKTVEVTAQAILETDAPPSLSTLVSAFKGGKAAAATFLTGTIGIGAILGISSALVDVCAGWFQNVVNPTASATLTVTYHEPGVKLHIEDVNRVVLDFRGKKRLFGMVGGLVEEKSHHVYDGYIQLGKDSLWHGQVTASVKGAYSTIDSAAIGQRAVQLGRVNEGSSFQEAIAAVADWFHLIGDPPICKGVYQGTQTFAVDGSSTSSEAGTPQVELALIPVGPPESYTDNTNCPWTKGEIEGIETLPVRVAKGEETALVIDAPKPGEKMITRDHVSIPDVFRSTVVTVGP